jgi:low affinity sulfate transporter 2
VPDFVQYIISLVLILVLNLEYGLIAAVVVSLLGLIYVSFRPAFQRLGRLPGTQLFVDAAQFPDAFVVSHCVANQLACMDWFVLMVLI